jgi:hypothetical protein
MDFRNVKMYPIDMLSITQCDNILILFYIMNMSRHDALQKVEGSMQTVEVIQPILVIRESSMRV